MRYFRFHEWRRFQHYTNRNPPWIKLYVDILDPDGSWAGLDDRRRGQLANLLAYAARMDNVMPMDNDMISQEIGATSPLDLLDFNELIEIHDNRASCVASDSASKTASKNAITRGQRTEDIYKSSEGQRTETKRKEDTLSRRERDEACPVSESKADIAQAVERILTHLNSKSGKKFATSGPKCDASAKLVADRLKQGHTEQELCRVVDMKVNEWRGRDMDMYLRPATLFNKTKFEQYMGELNATPKYQNIVDRMREEQELLGGEA